MQSSVHKTLTLESQFDGKVRPKAENVRRAGLRWPNLKGGYKKYRAMELAGRLFNLASRVPISNFKACLQCFVRRQHSGQAKAPGQARAGQARRAAQSGRVEMPTVCDCMCLPKMFHYYLIYDYIRCSTEGTALVTTQKVAVTASENKSCSTE